MHGRRKERRIVGEHHAIVPHPLFADVQRRRQGQSQSLSLPHRIPDQSAVAPQHLAVRGDEIPRGVGLPGHSFDHLGIFAVRHEANVLALPPLLADKPQGCGKRFDLTFAQVPQGEAHAGKLRLRQSGKKIALIFFRVRSLTQKEAFSALLYPCIMPRGKQGVAHLPGAFEQGAEFDLPITQIAGIRRQSRFIGGGKRLHDRAPENRLHLHHGMRNADLLCDRTRVPCVPLIVHAQAHGHARAVRAVPAEQIGGKCGIHSAAHSHHDFFPFHSVFSVSS
ncbi:uncharacterized protein BN660_00260 [Clostridium sp. CAG:448]|nr:uncharacterized protein BN660_00260 [Clostridium sp. CAG:448]